MILGEEKTTPWPRTEQAPQFQLFSPQLKRMIEAFCLNGGKLFISGAYVGTDCFAAKDADHPDALFAQNILKFTLGTGRASKQGIVVCSDEQFMPRFTRFDFNTTLNDSIYAVESPDAIVPVNGASTLLRYRENGFSAAVGFRSNYSVLTCGFPFETILGERARAAFMRAVLEYLASQDGF